MPLHSSIPLPQIEFIDLAPMDKSPLISHCQIKVCYVGDSPNRNGSVITKEVAESMAPSLRGAAIVGFYNEAKEDFEGHNISIDVSGGELKIRETTKPYGFVPTDAKVWFQVFNDDNLEQHEYLMTEGYLWTGQYPECERILAHGNNQSMELDEKSLKADWATDLNGEPEFFIINEAIISKLCILGEDVEPCFEGASITQFQFSFGNDFKEQLSYMINELNNLFDKGGAEMETENEVVSVETDEVPAEVEFSKAQEVDAKAEAEAVEIISEEIDFKKKEEDKNDESEVSDSDNSTEDNEKEEKAAEESEVPEDKEDSEDDEEEKDKKKKYNLEEIPEYVQLKSDYSSLKNSYNELIAERDSLKAQLEPLVAFKANVEKKEKQDMIDSFYMLTEEDKRDVINNIDTYSLDDIEAKLSIICVRNKVSFNDNANTNNDSMNFNLSSLEEEDSSIPAWIKAALETEKNLK